MVLALSSRRYLAPAALFLVCGLVLLQTCIPTIYGLDSAEFVTAAYTLGFAHSPGYPLYLIALHLFSGLPIGDVGFRGNLFSALCLVVNAPLLYLLFLKIGLRRGRATALVLAFTWSYYIWSLGLLAETAMAQILSLTICGILLSDMCRKLDARSTRPLWMGLSFGLAVATHPASILFAPGMIAVFRWSNVTWRKSIIAGVLAVMVFFCFLLYFPIRLAAHPSFNSLGSYNAQGIFEPVQVQTISGLLWVLRGQQFRSLFFSSGLLPSWQQLLHVGQLFFSNFLGFGIPLGLLGLYRLYLNRRSFLFSWLLFFVPFTYFYTTFGAADIQQMLGPSFLLWMVPLAVGLDDALDHVPRRLARVVVVALPLLLLVTNYPRLNLSHETSIRQRGEAILSTLPPHALVFSEWADANVLAYLQKVEQQREDIQIYNLFLFPAENLRPYIAEQIRSGGRIIFVTDALPEFVFQYTVVPFDIKTESKTDMQAPIQAWALEEGS